MLRELTEETGLTGRIDSLAFAHSSARLAQPEAGVRPWHSIRIVYRVTISGNVLRHESNESSDRAEWATLPSLESRPVTELVKATLDWLHTDPSHR